MTTIENESYTDIIYSADSKQNVKIYVDDVELNTSYLRDLTYDDGCLSSDTFSLGGASISQMTITLNKDALENITYQEGTEFYFTQIITYGDTTIEVPIGYFYVHLDDVDTSDEYSVKFVLSDKMYDISNGTIDFSEYVESENSFTRLDLVNLICEKYGIELATKNFIGYDKEVGTYDNTLSCKSWLVFVSERAGGFVKVGRDKQLYIKSFGEVDKVTIPTNTKGEATAGELKTITGVRYQNGTQDFFYGDETGMVVYLSQDNYFSCDESEVSDIYDSLNGLYFQTLNVRIWGDPSLDSGDIITIGDYTTICQKEWTWGNGWYGYYNTTIEEATSSLEVEKLSAQESRKRVYSLIDEANTAIELATEEISENSEKITNLNITLDGLTTTVSNITDQTETIAKMSASIEEIKTQIENVTDVTVSSSALGTAKLDGVMDSEVIYLRIYPTAEDISYLYPTDHLYPADDLYPLSRDLIFTDEDGNETVFTLPCDLLYCDGTYDEFILDYENQQMYKIKRVGIDSDGYNYILDEATTVYYDFESIYLSEGTYTVKMLSFDTAYIIVRGLANNLYTAQYVTQYQLSTSLSQTESSITASVNAQFTDVNAEITEINGSLELKIDKDDNDQIVSMLNASANQINFVGDRFTLSATNCSISANGTITATNVDLTGKITASSGVIGGFDISSTSFSKTISGTYDYNKFDLKLCHSALLGSANLNSDPTAFDILDTSDDGSITILDLLQIRKVLLGETNDKTVTGDFILDATNPKNFLKISDSSGNLAVSIGLGGVNSNEIVAQNIICMDTTSTSTDETTRVVLNGIDGNIYASGTITCNTLTQTSIAEKKKDFELYQGALGEINKIDIYKFHFIEEKNRIKKHLGFVIGDGYNYSTEITNSNNDGVDIYSMVSMCLQGIKELYQQIERLEEKVNEK